MRTRYQNLSHHRKKRFSKIVKIGFISLSVITMSGVVWWSFKSESNDRHHKPFSKSVTENKLHTIQYTSHDEKGNKRTLNASRGVQISKDHFDVENPIFYFDTKRGESIQVQAKSAILDQAKKMIEAKGGITVVSSQGYRIETPQATLDTEKSVIAGDHGVKAEYNQAIAKARSFSFDQSRRILSLSGNVVLNSKM